MGGVFRSSEFAKVNKSHFLVFQPRQTFSTRKVLLHLQILPVSIVH